MNKINPLHIGILLIVILITLIVKLDNAKAELKESKELYKETEKLATNLSGLKEVYADKKATKKSLERVLRLSSLKSAAITQKSTKSSTTLKSKSMNINALNSLMGKLLNGSYNIKNLKIKKLNDEKVSLHVEISW